MTKLTEERFKKALQEASNDRRCNGCKFWHGNCASECMDTYADYEERFESASTYAKEYCEIIEQALLEEEKESEPVKLLGYFDVATGRFAPVEVAKGEPMTAEEIATMATLFESEPEFTTEEAEEAIKVALEEEEEESEPMTTEERIEELKEQATEIIENDDDLHTMLCEELDSWCGFLGDDRYYDMYEFDDLMCDKSPLEIAEMVQGADFDVSDEYFRFTIWGIESSDCKDYTGSYDAEEVLENVLDELTADSIRWMSSDLADIINEIECLEMEL